jgi:hypothetical protein
VGFRLGAQQHALQAEAGCCCAGSFTLPAFTEAGERILACEVGIDGTTLAELPVKLCIEGLLAFPQPPHLVAAGRLQIELANPSRHDSRHLVALHCSGGIDCQHNRDLELAPGGTATITCESGRLEPYAELPLTVTARLADGSEVRWQGSVGDNPIHRLTPLLGTGFAAWEALPAIDLARHGTVKMTRAFGGEADCSGRVWLGCDENHFYLAAAIRDDQHCPPPSARGQGDMIEFIIAPYTPWAGAAQRTWPGEGFNRFALALCPSGPQLFQWKGYSEDEGAQFAGDAVVRAERVGEVTRYEVAIPRAGRRLFAADSKLCSVSLLVRDAEGEKGRNWIEWGSGFAEGKKRQLFKCCRLA